MLLDMYGRMYINPQVFQWAPTLGGECYHAEYLTEVVGLLEFQWAPTLGGECYVQSHLRVRIGADFWFQWAPTLGGECYVLRNLLRVDVQAVQVSMGTHPWG